MFAYEAAYETDLAFIHDAGFTQLAESAATLALEILDGGPLGPVLELGCGGGVTARRLADAGHEVHGIDISEQQVALARGRVPTGHFQTGPLLDAQTPPGCIAVLAIGEVLNYAFDPRADDSGLPGLFARLAAGLVPGGLLLFDSAGPGRAPGGTVRNFAQGDDWSILHEANASVRCRELLRPSAEVVHPVFPDGDEVLDPHTEATGKVDPGLYRDHIPHQQLVVGALREPRRLMNGDPNAMAEAGSSSGSRR